MKAIAVPSKGRPDSVLLSKHEGFFVFVEPQDHELYVKNFPQHTIIDICENDMGGTYARNFILEYMEESFWQLDDDINGFFYREGKRLIKCSIEYALESAEHQFESVNTNLGALSFRNLAWSCDKDIYTDGACLVCVYISNIPPIFKYRWLGGGEADRDFSMQCIAAGLNVHRTSLYAFNTPVSGKGKGGLEEHYANFNERQEQCYNKLIEFWGEHIVHKELRPDGRLKARVNWKALKSKQQKILFQ